MAESAWMEDKLNKPADTRGAVCRGLNVSRPRMQALGGPQPDVVKTLKLDARHFQFRSELRPLLNKVRNALARGLGTVLHLTSPTAGEGVSTVARELACAAAGIPFCRPLLLDFNYGEGGQSAVLGGALPGVVSGYMAKGTVEVAAVAAGSSVFHAAEFDMESFDAFTFNAVADAGGRMSLLTNEGSTNEGSADEGAPERPRTIAGLYASLCGAYNLIVVDCPPVEESPYFVPLAHDMPDVILVVRAERTRISVVIRAKDEIPALGGRLAGVVMNQRRSYVPRFIDRLL